MKNHKNNAKISECLWQYHKDVPSNPITGSESFKFKPSLKNKNRNSGSANVEITGSLKYLS